MNKQAFLLNGGARISWDIENQKIAKETENFMIRLRFYLTIRCRILLRLYHCQIRPNQSLCTHWNSVKMYWTGVLTPPLLSRATIAYKSKIITWTNGIYGYPINLQRNCTPDPTTKSAFFPLRSWVFKMACSSFSFLFATLYMLLDWT